MKEITIEELRKGFIEEFNQEPKYFYSAPGRSELSGNHTDHQHGKVLAAAIDLDTRAAVSFNDSNNIVIKSFGYPKISLSLDDLDVKDEEAGTSTALVRGIAKRFKELGYKANGFDAYIMSNVLNGSGLSSSAAFEVLIGTIFNDLNNGCINAAEIAKISQYSENVYFKKPCGLMDQMASSIGGCVFIDFKNNDNPIIEKVDFDFDSCGYSLCVIDSGANHSDLTKDYANITKELKKVCLLFNKEWLRDVDEMEFFSRIKEIKDICGGRAVLRALHVFEENRRVDKQVKALKENDFNSYLKIMKESGRSSWMYLQNVIPENDAFIQDLAFAIGVCEKMLGDNGVCRVHGGGFAGTLQAFVKNEFVEEFKQKVNSILGEESCHILRISSLGGHKIF